MRPEKPDGDIGLMGKSGIHRVLNAYISAKLETKLGIAFSTLAVLISALLTLALYLNVRSRLRQDIRERLRDVVGTAALTIDADAHATLTRRDQEDSPTYARLKLQLQQCRKRATDIRFAYTWRRNADGKLIFVVDAETDPNEISHIGEVYDSGEPDVLAKLATLDQVMVDDTPNSDKWGTWLSGYAPFYRSDGQMEGILGMDIKASDVFAHERRFLWIALAVFGATVPLALAVGLSFGGRLAAPIVQLTRSTERIAQGDWSHRVTAGGSHETHRLAHSFNRMTDALQKAISLRDEEIDSRKKAENALDVLNRDLQLIVDRLSRANEELRSFAAITSHDLKTPLRGIKVLTDWIAADYGEKFDASGKECLRLLASRITRMFNYIEAVHQYTSVGYAKESEAPLDLHMLVCEVISTLAVPANVQVEIEGHLPVIQCNRDRIAQVFQSLLSNAIRYADKPNGRVVIRCGEGSACWLFSVMDNGPGIDEQYHQKIFEIFQTLITKDESESRGAGLGIGLSIAKKIVELYDGRIWVDSTPGEGSTFFFTLPRQAVVSARLDTCPADSAA